MTDAATVAGTVSTVDEAVLTALPYVSMLLGVIPGAQVGVPVVAGVGALLQAVDGAAKAVAAGKPGASPQDIITEVVNHFTQGQPNSPILAG